jgi:uncharacterized phage-associated protein
MLQIIKKVFFRIIADKFLYICPEKNTKMNLTEEKQKNFINFFTEKNGGVIERLELMKFIWMSDRLHLNKYGRTISKDSYCALRLGPIPSRIMDLSKYNNESFEIDGYNVKSKANFNPDFFSKSDIEIMEYTWNRFNKMGSIEFSDYSHEFPEWLRFKKMLDDKSLPNAYTIVMQDFFEFPKLEEFNDILTEENIEQSKIQYNSHSSIQEFLRN